MRDLKYLFAYVAPIAAYLAVGLGGTWSFGGFFIAFVTIPILEFIFQGNGKNFTVEEEDSKLKSRLFDLMLYLNVPMVWGLVIFFLWTVSTQDLLWWEVAGMTLSVGIILGADGINVAHELGHRETWYERMMAKMLLLPEFYLHFIIEHNYGHHKWVSTDKDPASSRLNETLYAFFFRSVTGSYMSAWKISADQTARKGHRPYGIKNPMVGYQIIQFLYALTILLVFGWTALGLAVIAGIIGFLLLECVNYIEHYGLRRKKLPSGRYEPVREYHSWNSNHELGRIFLYELTRHSDHHYKANRKYQVLRHFEESPQLPLGYPASMLMSFIPPLWFAYMNPKVEKYNNQLEETVLQRNGLSLA